MASGARDGTRDGTKSKYFKKYSGSNISSASGRPITRSSTDADASNTSIDAENSDILSELKQSLKEIKTKLNELEEIKTDVKNTVKTEDLKGIVTSMVKDIMKQQKDHFDERLKEVEDRNRTERSKLKEEIDQLNVENERLKEMIVKKGKEVDEAVDVASLAMYKADEARAMANYNEQYSRKNNVKLYGIDEKENENTEAEVTDMLKTQTNTVLKHDDIVAVHRIPGKKTGQPRPILLKLKNSDVKGRVISQRRVLKDAKSRVRLADDVTHENTRLLSRLNEHEMIESAWYFNGSIFGRVNGSGRKLKFRIGDDIEDRIKNSKERK